MQLTAWIDRHRADLCSGSDAASFRQLVRKVADSLEVDDLATAHDGVLRLYKETRAPQERRRLRAALSRLDDAIARAGLEREIHLLTDAEFTALTTLPLFHPFRAADLLPKAVADPPSEVLDRLMANGLVRQWPEGLCVVSTRGAVFRKVAGLRVHRKTAAAVRQISQSRYSRRYRHTIKEVLHSGTGEPKVVEAMPTVSLPLGHSQPVASIPTMIVALSSPTAISWERISTNSLWSRIQVYGDVDRFRAEAADFLRSMYVTSTPAETLEVLAITLQDAETALGQELSRIVDRIRLSAGPAVPTLTR